MAGHSAVGIDLGDYESFDDFNDLLDDLQLYSVVRRGQVGVELLAKKLGESLPEAIKKGALPLAVRGVLTAVSKLSFKNDAVDGSIMPVLSTQATEFLSDYGVNREWKVMRRIPRPCSQRLSRPSLKFIVICRFILAAPLKQYQLTKPPPPRTHLQTRQLSLMLHTSNFLLMWRCLPPPFRVV